MTPLSETALELQNFFIRRQWQFCIIGGIAVLRWGEPRFPSGCFLQTCSAEDLVVQKLFAFRARDLPDVETIVLRQRGRLDWDYIDTQLRPLAELKQQPEIMHALSKLRQA